jgi:2-polyprenyl-3-methyl-5-hydroxy-6-metoxy-1,4-benzoquinol methylase
MKCFYCHKETNLYIKSSNNKKREKINFTSTEINLKKTEVKPDLFICKDCHVIFSEFCNLKFEKNYVDIEDQLYIDQIKNKEIYFENLINKISKYINLSDRAIEVGSYYGAFGSQIIKKIRNYEGIELSSKACEYATKKYGLKITNANVFDFFSKNHEKFDLIFLFDVVEHLDDPKSVLKILSQNLSNNGKIIFTTMNMDSLFAKITGKSYPWIIAQHKFYFTTKNLEKILQNLDMVLKETINDVRIISLNYFFFKISQKIFFFIPIYNFLKKFNFFENIKIKLSFFDINIYCVEKIKTQLKY